VLAARRRTIRDRSPGHFRAGHRFEHPRGTAHLRKRSDKNINYGIERTAETRPGDFWAFNNGVTALVSEIIADKNAGELAVRGITIVNGAQTTGALAAAASAKGARVLARFVQCLGSWRAPSPQPAKLVADSGRKRAQKEHNRAREEHKTGVNGSERRCPSDTRNRRSDPTVGR
jgi:hypothetical protein